MDRTNITLWTRYMCHLPRDNNYTSSYWILQVFTCIVSSISSTYRKHMCCQNFVIGVCDTMKYIIISLHSIHKHVNAIRHVQLSLITKVLVKKYVAIDLERGLASNRNLIWPNDGLDRFWHIFFIYIALRRINASINLIQNSKRSLFSEYW